MNNHADRCPVRDMVRSLGWKVYENRVSNPIEERWMVFLVRGDQRILARAPTPKQSWALAAGMLEDLDCGKLPMTEINPYESPVCNDPPQKQLLHHSGVGIASFCIAIAGLATFTTVFNYKIVGRPASDMMAYKLLGLILILPTVGAVLGINSLYQRQRYRLLPIAGLTINVLLGIFLLLIIVPSLGHELGYW